MALTAQELIETAHKAVRGFSGIGATFTFDSGGPFSGVILEGMVPDEAAGLEEGQTNTQRMLPCSVLTADMATAPEPGEGCTIAESPYSGINWQVMPASVSTTQGDHRFTLYEG